MELWSVRVSLLQYLSKDLFRIMSDHLNLNPHIILSQPCHAHTRPQGLMIRHILCEVSDHCIQSFIVNRDMVRVHTEDLLPSFAASVFQVQLDVLESLVDLRVDLFIKFTSIGVPAT